MRSPRFLFLVLLILGSFLRADEPFFKKDDVIALVGGEDMVAMSEYGYLELLLTRALPDYHLRFRNLAWEGDTVFEQRRDLNFPTWEEQLDKIGATAVICQFGQMESLAGQEKLPEFIAAYEKLLARFSGGGKRRMVIITPLLETPRSEVLDGTTREELDAIKARKQQQSPALDFHRAITSLAAQGNWRCVPFVSEVIDLPSSVVPKNYWEPLTRDGVHLSEHGQRRCSAVLAVMLGPHHDFTDQLFQLNAFLDPARKWANGAKLRELVIAKNRLWFDYWRVQNWAFLAGDRTNQPSSRDHLDPTKRWFPAEREKFLPLIEAKEKEIDALAAQLAAP